MLSKRTFIAVFDPLGGQTVTIGNSSSVMGWVVRVVDTGDSCHSLYELVIMLIAKAKEATTIAIHVIFSAQELEVVMCPRPWIVELCRNCRKIFFAIFSKNKTEGKYVS